MGGSFVTAGDWNGDGVPDLLIRQGVGNGILVALGPFKENEPIALSHEIDVTAKGFVLDFAVPDWGRHGTPDLLVRQVFLHRSGTDGIHWHTNTCGAGLRRMDEGKLLVETSSDMHVQGFFFGSSSGAGWPDLSVTRDVLSRASPDGKQDWGGTAWLYLRESPCRPN